MVDSVHGPFPCHTNCLLCILKKEKEISLLNLIKVVTGMTKGYVKEQF